MLYFIGHMSSVNTDRKFHLQELVIFMPGYLKSTSVHPFQCNRHENKF